MIFFILIGVSADMLTTIASRYFLSNNQLKFVRKRADIEYDIPKPPVYGALSAPIKNVVDLRKNDQSTAADQPVDLHNKEFCVDVSTYQPVVWVERDGEECKTDFVKQCEDKSENVCAEVTETFCEVLL